MRWVASVLKKNDALSAKACFPPLNSKGYQYPSVPPIPKNRTCQTTYHLFPGGAPSLPCGLGESDSVKSTNSPSGKRGSPFHSERDSKFTLHS